MKKFQKKASHKSREYKLPQQFQSILTEDELPVYEDYFNLPSTKKLREKLVELLEKKIEDNYQKNDKQTRYASPSWAEYQADAIGARRSIRELINLLK